MDTQASRRLNLKLRCAIAAAVLLSAAFRDVAAQEDMGRVTLMAGTPRMVGESIRPLQAIVTGQRLETGPADAAGLLVKDVVVHVGVNSVVTVFDEPGRKRIQLDRGYVVVYTDAGSRTEVVVATPFGALTVLSNRDESGSAGRYAVRHDPAQANVSPAASMFAAIEGTAEVIGTAPQAGPHTLLSGRRWRIVQGRIPGPPGEGDERIEAERLRQMLHRETVEMLRTQGPDLTRLAVTDLSAEPQRAPIFHTVAEEQLIVDVNASAQMREPVSIPQDLGEPVELVLPTFAFGGPRDIPAGAPARAGAQLVSYEGVPANTEWNQFLTAVDGNPGFQPTYVTDFANAGFSYIQLAGPDAQLAQQDGAPFLVAESGASSGWALYTPLLAVGDEGFDAGSPLAAVVNDGLEAIALGAHLSDGGSIGGGGDPSSAFAIVADGAVQLNPDLPPGYPLLDQAGDTTGLTVNGQVPGDQIAALGAGRDPQQLSQTGPQLLFLSASDQDALGNRFNFDGTPIAPTNLNLPADRNVELDTSGAAATAAPLDAVDDNTVGLQFAARGDIVAIVHHTGLRDSGDGAGSGSEHFEIERGATYLTVRWREEARPVDDNGEPLEFEELNDHVALRDELFALLATEVNSVVPEERHTAFGPAVIEPASVALRRMFRHPGRWTRITEGATRHELVIRRHLNSDAALPTKARSFNPAGGRLIRATNAAASHRHIGRVSRGR